MWTSVASPRRSTSRVGCGSVPRRMKATRRGNAAAIERGPAASPSPCGWPRRSVGKTNTPLGIFYRRIRSRIGGLGAVKATAHKLACLVYRMLKYGQEYVVTVDGGVRGQDEGQSVEVAAAQGGGDGLPTDSNRHAVNELERGRRHGATGLWLRTTLRNQHLHRPSATMGVWGRFVARPLLNPRGPQG